MQRLSLATLFLFVSTLAACANDTTEQMMMEEVCESDGTARGDCEKFACEVRKASNNLCPANTMRSFNCEGIDAFPTDYQEDLQDYFFDCAREFDTYMDTTVETMQGPVAIDACAILGCAITPNSTRMVGPMAIKAECAPVGPLCSFADPPTN